MKRFFTLFLALTLALSCLFIAPLSVNAATDKPFQVLKSDNTVVGTYATLGEAVDTCLLASEPNYVIRLLENITLTVPLTVNSFKAGSYTIDGNGFGFTYEAATATTKSALTFTGVTGANVTLKNLNVTAKKAACVLVNAGHVTFNGGTYRSENAPWATQAIDIAVDSTKKLPVSADFISGNYLAIVTEDVSDAYQSVVRVKDIGDEKDCTANFYGGYYYAEQNVQATLMVADYAVVNVYGGTFENTTTVKAAYALMVTGGKGTSVAGTKAEVYGGNFILPTDAEDGVVLLENKNTSSMSVYGANVKGGGLPAKYFIGTTKQYPEYPATLPAGSFYSITIDGDSDLVSGTSPAAAGYSARLTEGTGGLRFTSTISKAVIDCVTALADAGTTLSYGTLIAPTETVSALNAFSIDALNYAKKAAGKDYVDVAANEGLTFDASGNAKINAAIIKIKAANYTKSFSAIAYIKATINGQTVYFYGAYDTAKSQSSIANVATLALADVKDAAEGNYTNLVSDGSAQDGKYSPYTAAQRAVLAAYLAAAN